MSEPYLNELLWPPSWPISEAWFQRPSPGDLSPYLSVELEGPEQGRCSGLWVPDRMACHRGSPKGSCVRAPGNVDLSTFLSQPLPVETSSGGRKKIQVGLLSIGRGHTDDPQDYGTLPDLSSAGDLAEAADIINEHYGRLKTWNDMSGDPIGRAFAIVNVGIEPGYCWLAGVVVPGVVSRAMAVLASVSKLSGDWQLWSTGKYSLQGICAVVKPGYNSKSAGKPVERIAASDFVDLGLNGGEVAIIGNFSDSVDSAPSGVANIGELTSLGGTGMGCEGNCKCSCGEGGGSSTSAAEAGAEAQSSRDAKVAFARSSELDRPVSKDDLTLSVPITTTTLGGVTFSRLTADGSDLSGIGADEKLLRCTFTEGPTDDGRVFAIGGCTWRDPSAIGVGYNIDGEGHDRTRRVATCVAVERTENVVSIYARFAYRMAGLSPDEALASTQPVLRLSAEVENLLSSGVLTRSSMNFALSGEDPITHFYPVDYGAKEVVTVEGVDFYSFTPRRGWTQFNGYSIIGCDIVGAPAMAGNLAEVVSPSEVPSDSAGTDSSGESTGLDEPESAKSEDGATESESVESESESEPVEPESESTESDGGPFESGSESSGSDGGSSESALEALRLADLAMADMEIALS